MRVRGFGVAVASLVAALLTGSTAPAPAVATDGTTFKRAVTLSRSAVHVEEGDRFTVSARIASPRKARRVILQQWYVPSYGDPSWQPVKSVRVADRSRVRFKRVATGLNSERFRARVTYRTGRPVASKPVAVKVWRWIPLWEYSPYYSTSGAIFGETTLNGQRYKGWGAAAYSDAGAWESRFTPGRHCTAFRGVLGVADISADGSSGSIAFTADDVTVYESPVLTPGMDVSVEVSLTKPYRFGIQAANTSPEDVKSWPVIGDPAFLCTGV